VTDPLPLPFWFLAGLTFWASVGVGVTASALYLVLDRQLHRRSR